MKSIIEQITDKKLNQRITEAEARRIVLDEAIDNFEALAYKDDNQPEAKQLLHLMKESRDPISRICAYFLEDVYNFVRLQRAAFEKLGVTNEQAEKLYANGGLVALRDFANHTLGAKGNDVEFDPVKYDAVVDALMGIAKEYLSK